MYLINRFLSCLIVSLIAVPFSVYADSWSCSKQDLVREVHVEYATTSPVPCIVVYKKPNEGFEDQTLWSADNTEGYCEEKASEFVAKLESWGWVCRETLLETDTTPE